MRAVEQLLRETIGLDIEAIGHTAVERAVHQRQQACGLSADAYLHHLGESPAELQELVDEVVIVESWFFRDPQAFSALTRIVRDEWLPGHPGDTLRLLSLAAATGEEPFSMAMALLDAGIPAERFIIDGVDVSTRALAHAMRGVFASRSFRGNGVDIRERYFIDVAGGRRVGEEVRRQVHFRRANICASGSLPGTAVYDVIFCRNLLVYLDRATQDRALDVIERLLTPTGVLFVAPCETGLLLNRASGWSMEPRAFGFRRGLPHDARPLSAPRPPRPAASQVAYRANNTATARALDEPEPIPAPQWTPPDPRGARKSLDEATLLADQGRFAEAATRCEEHVRLHGPSAAVFHLLGVLREANGDTDAALSCFRQCLFLDPDNQVVLTHLSLLLEKIDKPAEARFVRGRERRLAKRMVR
jgi:chemotaxis protein methyltransferase WspC